MRKIKGLLILYFSCVLFSFTYAQEGKYTIDLIPAELLQNSNAVKRIEERKLVIKAIDKAIFYNKYAITILNEAGEQFAEFYDYYDKFRTINYVKGSLFDAAGNKIRTLKTKEINDISLSSGASFVEDGRIKQFKFNYKTYPYTIEFEYAIELKGVFHLPTWTPIENENIAVQSSNFSVECPTNYPLRYKNINCSTGQPVIIQTSNSNAYTWKVENIASMQKEKYAPEWYQITPTVFLAPTDFAIDNFKGNMRTWAEFGKFMYQLNQGRNQLPENIKKTVHQLTDGLTNKQDKIKILYEYLQKNTRYVSIQLGIGGWQTFDAYYVANKGYGDCKALSNYMCALLNEIGIKAYYTLIKAGKGQKTLLSDFPSTQFNHIIVCVPVNKDSIWLECTSQTIPMGYLSSFTADRDALLIDESGGILVHTPKYGIHENNIVKHIDAIVNEEGDLKTKIIAVYKGEQQDNLHQIINGLSKEKLMDYVKNKIELPSYDVINFDYKEDKQKIPAIVEHVELSASNYATISGKRLFINPNILSTSKDQLKTEGNRKNNIVLNDEFTNTDTVNILFPKGYNLESIAPSIKIETKFGKYMSTIKVQENNLTYYRYREQFSGNYPVTDYGDFVKFYNDMYKADHTKVVLIKVE